MRRAPLRLAAPLLLAAPSTALADDFMGPWVQQVTENQAWVLWEGDPDGVVEWGPQGGLGRETRATETTGDVQHAQLLQLDPATRYHYQVRHGDGTSDAHSFRTARSGSETSFSFVVISDTQHDSSNPRKLSEILDDGVVPWCLEDQETDDIDQAIDLVLVVGDLVNDGWDHDQWRDEFFGPAQELMAAVPFYPALGNHEANSDLYFDLFRLPDNGSEDHLEHWWFLDRANARFIGLDSNAPYTGETQQAWLHAVLDNACADETIDFVFATLHHPYKSELWPPGESDFTGEVIEQLDEFANGCGKPAVHFFGHTHGYSRGQSRDAPHAWINVATASGNIDYWDEYAQIDYDNFVISLDEYGFVVVDVTASDNPTFRVRRIGRGDEYEPTENEEQDSLRVERHPSLPATPEARSPAEQVSPWCVHLAASPYCDPEAHRQGSSHWQVSTSCDDFDQPVYEAWDRHLNVYRDETTETDVHLQDHVLAGLDTEQSWCWRVRYRDRTLAWSDWSEPTAFETGASELSDNLLENPGGEDGTQAWEAMGGPVESLGSGECDSGEAHTGTAFLAVGGVCEEGVDYAEARQTVDIGAWVDQADAGELTVRFGGWTASYSGSDLAQLELRFQDEEGLEIGNSDTLGEPSSAWSQLVGTELVPTGTRSIEFVLMGTRNAGQDCDAYFDDLFLQLDSQGALTACLEPPDYPWADEEVSCEDAAADSDDPGDTAEPGDGKRCGCASTGAHSLPGWLLFCALGAFRKRR